jgi:hypothetical protein
MFNVYQFDHKLKGRQSQEDEAVKAYRLRQAQKKANKAMSENYRQRVSQFIMSMMLDPIKVKEHQRPLETAGRDSDPSLFKGRAIFITKGFKSEKQRIKDALDNNQFLESQPAYLQEVYRTRHEEKEVNPRMYFKPKTGLERVRDALLARNVEFNDDNSESQLRGKSMVQSQSSVSRKTSQQKDLMPAPKDMLMSLHRKTHFKALTSVMLGGQHSSLRDVKSQQDLRSGTQKLGTALKPIAEVRIEHVMKEGEMKTEEAMNLAKNVLETCRVRQKPGTVPVLRQGMGRLVSNPDSHVIDVYRQICSPHGSIMR